jgi:hypothetical protein
MHLLNGPLVLMDWRVLRSERRYPYVGELQIYRLSRSLLQMIPQPDNDPLQEQTCQQTLLLIIMLFRADLEDVSEGM